MVVRRRSCRFFVPTYGTLHLSLTAEHPLAPSDVPEARVDLKLVDKPSQMTTKLVVVPIHFSTLPGVDHEPITLFADSSTTAG